MTALDFRPLSSPVSTAQLKAFRRQNAFGTQLLVRILLGIVVVLVGAMVMAFLLDSPGSEPDSTGQPRAVLIVVVILGVGSAFLVLGALNSRRIWRRRYRISQFASRNGLVFAMHSGSPTYPGEIFQLGNNHTVTEQLFSVGQSQLDLGNYRYTTGSGKNKKTHDWGYVAIKLKRMLPHMVLDARSNNLFGSNLPTTFSRNQVLKLEGDFDRYFTLYCPKPYETDALYIFTPDLMALFIDEAANMDVEIVDDWMLLYSSAPFDLSDATALARLFRIVDSVGDKARDRSAGYADSRLAGAASDNASGADALTSRTAIDLVAPRGQRLTNGLPAVGVVIVGVIVLIALANLLPFLRGG